jgi:hypothetical protein
MDGALGRVRFVVSHPFRSEAVEWMGRPVSGRVRFVVSHPFRKLSEMDGAPGTRHPAPGEMGTARDDG